MPTPLENILMTRHKEEMISFMKSHPEVFDEAILLAISDRETYSWRAAWLLWGCMEENDPRVQGSIKDIIDSLPGKTDGHQRELIKILLNMEIGEKHEGYLFDLCMGIWETINKKPSVRYTAFKFILKIAKKHPELSGEIDFLVQDHYMESLSPGVKHSLSKMIKEFKKK